MEEMSETERQFKQISKLIKYLEEVSMNDLCLKPKYLVKPEHFSWIKEMSLDEIDTKSLIDRVKMMVITHLIFERDKLKKKYLKTMTNKLFFRAKAFIED